MTAEALPTKQLASALFLLLHGHHGGLYCVDELAGLFAREPIAAEGDTDVAEGLLDLAPSVERGHQFASTERAVASVVVAEVHAAHRRRAALLAVGADVLTEFVGGGLSLHGGYNRPPP